MRCTNSIMSNTYVLETAEGDDLTYVAETSIIQEREVEHREVV